MRCGAKPSECPASPFPFPPVCFALSSLSAGLRRSVSIFAARQIWKVRSQTDIRTAAEDWCPGVSYWADCVEPASGECMLVHASCGSIILLFSSRCGWCTRLIFSTLTVVHFVCRFARCTCPSGICLSLLCLVPTLVSLCSGYPVGWLLDANVAHSLR